MTAAFGWLAVGFATGAVTTSMLTAVVAVLTYERRHRD